MSNNWTELVSSSHQQSEMTLVDGSRIAVVGGGPAGSFFSYFLLDLANHMGISLNVDIFEPRDFSQPAPLGCNMCDGINLPPTVVQRGIGSYHLHTDNGSVVIQTPVREKRIASVYRGAGPRDIKEFKWGSFDGHLQKLAEQHGARVLRQRVAKVSWVDDRPQIEVRKQPMQTYDLVVIATGVNGGGQRLIEGLYPVGDK